MDTRGPSLLGAIASALRSPVPPRRDAPSFGWLPVAIFLALGTSGALLALHYVPVPGAAEDSLRTITVEANWGWLVRGLHHWGSVLLIVLTLGQLVLLFLSGRYRQAGAGNWGLSVVLLLLVLALAFTGELLPWDARALALASATLTGVAELPVLGPALAALLRGAEEPGAATLARAHTAHTLVLPWAMFALFGLQMWFLARLRRGGAR